MVSEAPFAVEKTLQPGSMVGEYLIGEKLGEGGMGAVYAGQHPVIGKRVAVKVLSSACASNPDLVRRFVEEARAVNKIGHPNIIDIFSFGQLSNGRQYFVMEFLDGESLSDRLAKGAIAPTELRRLLRQICSALEAAHRTGIIHRDLKPENIWVAKPQGEDSYVKLLDFGIAKLVDVNQTHITQTGAAMGSPQFMPPEQCMGRPVDRRADIYAMGVILYRIFTGKMPFVGPSLPELIYQQTTQPPLPPSRHRPIAADLERIILDCLEKDPARRPATARELGERLDRALRSEVDGGGSIAVPQPEALDVKPLPTWVSAMTPGFDEGGSTRSARGWYGPRLLVAVAVGVVGVVGTLAIVRVSGKPEVVQSPIAQMRPPLEKTTPSRPVLIEPEVNGASTPAKSIDVRVHIDSTPPGARVVGTADNRVLGRTPFDMHGRRGSESLSLMLDLRGWKAVKVDVPMEDDFDHSYELEKIIVPQHRHVVAAPSMQRPWTDPFAGPSPTGRPAAPSPAARSTPGTSPSSPLDPSPGPRPPETPKKKPLRI